MSIKPKILIIEDDRDLNNLLNFTLNSTKEFEVHSHFEGAQAFNLIEKLKPDLLILDVMLPGMEGTEILKRVRSSKDIPFLPVIMLTARTEEQDKLGGFEAGADDYITKPFSPKELLLRVAALLRRSRQGASQDSKEIEVKKRVVQLGTLTIFPEEFKVLVDSEVLQLTATEYQLLLFLTENCNKLYSRDALLEKVWGYEGTLNTRTVDTHVKRLRQKLALATGFTIETVHGFGYKISSDNSKSLSQVNNSKETTELT